jgi:hypothetical protein
MRVWTSGEIEGDIDQSFRLARKAVEQALTARVGSEDYGAGVCKWALIYIIMNEEDPAYPEIQRYTKSTGVVEFRLNVDHRAFTEGDPLRQRELLAATVLRSLDLSGGLRIPDFDADRFKRDVTQALNENKWT